MTVHTSAANTTANVLVTVHDNGNVVATHRGPTNQPFQFNVNSPKLWSPNSPKLYNVTVTLGKDQVQSYTGFRTISKGTVNGVVRPLLNGEFIFMFGTLDQGFWPDGIYVAPTKEAMVYDLKMLKNLGFNTVRKHVSICRPHYLERFILIPSVYRLKLSPSFSIRHATSSVFW